MTNRRKVAGPSDRNTTPKARAEITFGNRTTPESQPSSIRLDITEADAHKAKEALRNATGTSGEVDIGMRRPSNTYSGPLYTESAAQTLGEYVTYMDDVRAYCQSWDDLRGDSSLTMPNTPPRDSVLDAIAYCDKRDSAVKKHLVQIADRSEDKEIAAAAQKAILMQLGSAMTGIRMPGD